MPQGCADTNNLSSLWTLIYHHHGQFLHSLKTNSVSLTAYVSHHGRLSCLSPWTVFASFTMDSLRVSQNDSFRVSHWDSLRVSQLGQTAAFAFLTMDCLRISHHGQPSLLSPWTAFASLTMDSLRVTHHGQPSQSSHLDPNEQSSRLSPWRAFACLTVDSLRICPHGKPLWLSPLTPSRLSDGFLKLAEDTKGIKFDMYEGLGMCVMHRLCKL